MLLVSCSQIRTHRLWAPDAGLMLLSALVGSMRGVWMGIL